MTKDGAPLSRDLHRSLKKAVDRRHAELPRYLTLIGVDRRPFPSTRFPYRGQAVARVWTPGALLASAARVCYLGWLVRIDRYRQVHYPGAESDGHRDACHDRDTASSGDGL